ncbi:MAG: carnitine dehydratase [Alphaproteobacteria bacterium]|nr:carnitine dehydratase [Alphaproteobacteria bacterium]
MTGGPLAGIRIIEVAHVLAGPFSSMILGDLGADVVKVEPPGGDMARNITKQFTGPYNDYFASLNRNKRSVILDLNTQAGQAELAALAATASGLVTNLRPATIRRFGLTYQDLKPHNDRLVCLALTGFGLDGPYADKPAYDYIVQALTGVMTLTGDPGTSPTKAGYSAVDNSTGMMGAIGLLAKIIEGKGGQVDVSLFDTMLSQLNYLASGYLNHGILPRRTTDSAHPYMVPAQVFETSDGFLMLFVSTDKFWRKFCDVVDWSERADDPAFATINARAENRDTVIAAIGELISTDTTAHWVGLLGDEGIVVSGIETLDKALDGDMAATREMIAVIPTPDGVLRVVGNPIKMSDHPPHYAPPPLLGEHTEEILGTSTTATAK